MNAWVVFRRARIMLFCECELYSCLESANKAVFRSLSSFSLPHVECPPCCLPRPGVVTVFPDSECANPKMSMRYPLTELSRDCGYILVVALWHHGPSPVFNVRNCECFVILTP